MEQYLLPLENHCYLIPMIGTTFVCLMVFALIYFECVDEVSSIDFVCFEMSRWPSMAVLYPLAHIAVVQRWRRKILATNSKIPQVTYVKSLRRLSYQVAGQILR